ncbi:flagellar hook-basal body complex protein FliE [Mesobacterium sp. TK19101]|uniref:Flagellar hook-basal body complex protein FliE n=1 Tax=Mesobacterium hydrothermale TaxID=3111907 RepID=A0ABU6HGP6_9RHOB|nr:flagellar hook-basal body complex protein FliE [Mesobacterium sp. TK19101]MEC3861630.1 flagellar hook-basal body complex protein FliE [Mesobacterium sp. TK19101]
MDVRSLFAAQKYAATRTATAAGPAQPDIGRAVSDVASSFEQTLRQAEVTAQKAMIGDADPHALVHALAQSELAVEAAVTVRNKVVEAYQEILRMPV